MSPEWRLSARKVMEWEHFFDQFVSQAPSRSVSLGDRHPAVQLSSAGHGRVKVSSCLLGRLVQDGLKNSKSDNTCVTRRKNRGRGRPKGSLGECWRNDEAETVRVWAALTRSEE
ncbi:hypothetical protein E2C01_024981 [Portunus trituberculatus]|uniref:Uncharacterized protein n=1 Tax=Portunus trituberculatus TaxID=210409 RepID=A0A5B7EE98_PORTR|nr:hypothetical protein [Portunus trituberculatus]